MKTTRTGLLLLLVVIGFAGMAPLLGPRDYAKQPLAIRGDEAIAIQTATTALGAYFAKQSLNRSVRDFYAIVEAAPPSAWRVEWAPNDVAARGGGVEIILDTTGTRVTSVRAIE